MTTATMIGDSFASFPVTPFSSSTIRTTDSDSVFIMTLKATITSNWNELEKQPTSAGPMPANQTYEAPTGARDDGDLG